jgi:GxxExxY protein
MELLHKDITGKILEAYYEVYNYFGFGFLEKVYENSLYYLLSDYGLKVQQQAPIDVYFKKWRVGEYFADLLVEDKIIIELNATRVLAEEHEYQLINYLKATKIELGLLLNFGKTAEFKRKIFSNI